MGDISSAIEKLFFWFQCICRQTPYRPSHVLLFLCHKQVETEEMIAKRSTDSRSTSLHLLHRRDQSTITQYTEYLAINNNKGLAINLLLNLFILHTPLLNYWLQAEREKKFDSGTPPVDCKFKIRAPRHIIAQSPSHIWPIFLLIHNSDLFFLFFFCIAASNSKENPFSTSQPLWPTLGMMSLLNGVHLYITVYIFTHTRIVIVLNVKYGMEQSTYLVTRRESRIMASSNSMASLFLRSVCPNPTAAMWVSTLPRNYMPPNKGWLSFLNTNQQSRRAHTVNLINSIVKNHLFHLQLLHLSCWYLDDPQIYFW